MHYYSVARPYAKALFSQAKTSEQQLAWSDVMHFLSVSVREPSVATLLDNPLFDQSLLVDVLHDTLSGALSSSVGVLGDALKNFFLILVEANRLCVLPDIAELYHEMLMAALQVREVVMTSAFEVSPGIIESLKAKLEKHFGMRVELTCDVDPAVMGGAIIRSGDWVMDRTVRTQLSKLDCALLV